MNNLHDEKASGIYRTGIYKEGATPSVPAVNTYTAAPSITGSKETYSGKQFMVAPNVYDFTKAHDYDEEIVRYNLNKVKRPSTAIVIAPLLVKEVFKKEDTNFVRENKAGLNDVSHLNKRRAMEL